MRRIGQLRLTTIVILAACAAAQSPSPSPAPSANATDLIVNQFPLPAYLINSQASNVVVDWNHAIQWVLFESGASNTAPRLFAFIHTVMWDAWRYNNQSSNPADPAAVTTMLAMKNLVPLYFSKYDLLVGQHTANLTTSEAQKAQDMAKGPTNMFLSARLTDGFQDYGPTAPTSGPPGQYVITGYDAIRPVQQYSHTLPLVLPEDLDEVGVIADFPPHSAIGTMEYNNQYNTVAQYGFVNSTLRSTTQTATALFWGDHEASLTTILAQWNRLVLGTLSVNVTLEGTAALMAEYNSGMYDCIISTFFLSFMYNFWRPETAIQEGDPMHAPNSTWMPLLPTPGYPSYPSYGGCYANFSQTFLTRVYGTDQRTFTVTTNNINNATGIPLPSRVYKSFSQVATEVYQARYFSGTEFPEDSAAATILGLTIDSYLQNSTTVESGALAEFYTK